MVPSNRMRAREVLRGYLDSGAYKGRAFDMVRDYLHARYPRVYSAASDISLKSCMEVFRQEKGAEGLGAFDPKTRRIEICDANTFGPMVGAAVYANSLGHELSHAGDMARHGEEKFRDDHSTDIPYFSRPGETRAFRRGKSTRESFESEMASIDPHWMYVFL